MRNKIIKFTMLIVVLFLCFSAYVSYRTYKVLESNNRESLITMADVSIGSLKQTLELIRGTGFALSGSSSVEKWRADNSYFRGDDKKSRLNTEELSREMQRILVNNNVWNFDLFDYIAIYEKDEMLASTYTKPISLKQIEDSSKKIYEKIKDEAGFALCLPATESDSRIYTTLKIKTNFKGDDCLYIIGATPKESFEDKLIGLTGLPSSACYITDGEGTVFAAAGENTLHSEVVRKIALLPADTGMREIRVGNTPYELIKKPINSEFNFVYILKKAEAVKTTLSGMQRFILVMATFAAALIVIFIFMINEVKALLKASYESKLLLDEMEIKFLQHQMNPHFLFNILLTIQIRAKMSGDETIYKMISSLSALLRAGIYGDKRAMVPVSDELKYVEYYLWLQKQRYEDRLTYSIDIRDESVLNVEIPRLVVEPIVENAIVHGVETKEEGAKVSVCVDSAGDELVIHVVDNGVGFDAQRYFEKETDQGSREKMGLKNTDQRIKLLYGESYGLSIESSIGQGTDITIRLPKELPAGAAEKGILKGAQDERNNRR